MEVYRYLERIFSFSTYCLIHGIVFEEGEGWGRVGGGGGRGGVGVRSGKGEEVRRGKFCSLRVAPEKYRKSVQIEAKVSPRNIDICTFNEITSSNISFVTLVLTFDEKKKRKKRNVNMLQTLFCTSPVRQSTCMNGQMYASLF